MSRIFVFGANLDGNHAGGSARYAHLNRGAEMGVDEGPTGTAYALPTVGHNFARMDLAQVTVHVRRFLVYAVAHPEDEFQVTRVGCGLAGFSDQQISTLFVDAPPNCLFDEVWRPFLPSARFWGSF
jgi:hypothetical protein